MRDAPKVTPFAAYVTQWQMGFMAGALGF